MIARLRHTLRLCFRPHLWLLYAVSLTAAVIMVISARDWAPAVTRSFLMGYFEVFGSIAVVLGLGHVLTVDADDGAKEVLLTYPAPRSILALERIVAGFALAAGPLLVLAVAFGLFLPRAISEIELAALSMQTLLMDAVASWVFLAGLALIAAVLAESWVAGLLAGGLYWVTDLTTGGRFTSQLYLFYGTFSPSRVAPDTNRILLVVCGLAACVIAALAFGRIRRRR